MLRQTGDGLRQTGDGLRQMKVVRALCQKNKEIARMFVTVSLYRVRAGEEDALIALYEDWQRRQQPQARGYLAGELLRSIHNPREFIAIMRFESIEAARSLDNDPEQSAWFQRIVSLNDVPPILNEYKHEWSS